MHLTPKDIRTTFRVDATQAFNAVSTLAGKLQVLQGLMGVDNGLYLSLAGKIDIGQSGRGTAGMATGGAVLGPGPKGIDSVVRVLAPGEWVISDQAVDRITAAFGPSAMPMLNRGSHGGRQCPNRCSLSLHGHSGQPTTKCRFASVSLP